MHPECPVRRIQEEQILHQNVGGVLDVEQPGSVLPPDEVANAGYPPPDLALPVQGAHAAGGRDVPTEVLTTNDTTQSPFNYKVHYDRT